MAAGEGEGGGWAAELGISPPGDSDIPLPQDLGSVTPRPQFQGHEAQFHHL